MSINTIYQCPSNIFPKMSNSVLFKVLSEKTFFVLVQSNCDAFVHLVQFVCAGVKALGQTIQLDWARL